MQQTGGRGSISLVQVSGQNTGWESMNHHFGADWEVANAPDPPLSLRIVADDGEEARRPSFAWFHESKVSWQNVL